MKKFILILLLTIPTTLKFPAPIDLAEIENDQKLQQKKYIEELFEFLDAYTERLIAEQNE